jgi:hypothetical protein
MKNILLISGLVLFLFVLLFSCDKGEDPPPPPDETTNYCDCENSASPMTVVVSSAPTMAYIRLKEDAYGANNFYMYELDNTSNGFFYKGTTTPVEKKIEDKNWEVPGSYLWAAGRAGTDGHDPLVPVTGNEFIYPYLPWTPGNIAWKSSNGVINDKTEEEPKLDTQAPTLKDGHWYLARMVMGFSVNGKFNFATHCYQRIFKFERGTYE